MKKALVIVVVLGAALAGAWFAFGRGSGGPAAPVAAADVFTVARGPLDVSIVESATLRAERSVTIHSKVEGKSAVTWVIPEGTTVSAGDELIKLDVSELREKAENQAIAVSGVEADLVAAEKELEIQRNQNSSDLAKAQDAVLFARMDLEKFLGKGEEAAAEVEEPGGGTGGAGGDRPAEPDDLRIGEKEQQITKAQAAVELAEEELNRARTRLQWTRELHSRDYVTDNDLETDEIAVQQRENTVRHEKIALSILRNYTLARQERELNAKRVEAEAELERVNLRCTAQLAQKQAAVAAKKQQLDLQRAKLDKYKQQIEEATIKAPGPGIVVYAKIWDGNGETFLKVGMEVYQGRTLMLLPDLSTMIAECKVHEAQVDQVKVGHRVTVRAEAFPDLVFDGEVKRIGVLPDSENEWLAPDVKVYLTTILLKGDRSMLRPGQSASAEIHAAHLEDVLAVPVQAVFRTGRVMFVWHLDGDASTAVPVTTGATNDRMVVIEDGVSEGDRVALAEPAGVTKPEFPEIEARLLEEETRRNQEAAARAAAEASAAKAATSAGEAAPPAAPDAAPASTAAAAPEAAAAAAAPASDQGR